MRWFRYDKDDNSDDFIQTETANESIFSYRCICGIRKGASNVRSRKRTWKKLVRLYNKYNKI